MSAALRGGSYRLQAGFLLAVFALFLLNAAGVVDLSALPGGRVALNPAPLGGEFITGLGAQLARPPFVALSAVGAGLALALPALSPIAASLLTLLAMLPPFWAALADPVPPPLVPLEYTLVMVLTLFSCHVLLSWFGETHRRQRVLAVFGQYVPPALVDTLARDPEALSMRGESREMSVLFCDIKHFSTISENLEPDELAELLNGYLTAMTAVLHGFGATIDKYIGDAVMAFWGAPLRQPDHAALAVQAALAMQRRARELAPAHAHRGWPAVEIGIGVASGVASVGNMGSRYRVAYTVVGDVVNLAARLEALTRLYRVDVLVSERTRAGAAATRFRELDHVRVKGKHRSTRIYEPLAEGAVDEATLAREVAALAAYYAGDWDHARNAFEALAAGPGASPWYRVMRERMQRGAPPAGWDGIVRFGGETSLSLESDEPN